MTMTNNELQTLLKQYPDEMPVKLLLNSNDDNSPIYDLTGDRILHTSETAWFKEAEEEDQEDEMGLGDGQQYLLFNPIIV